MSHSNEIFSTKPMQHGKQRKLSLGGALQEVKSIKIAVSEQTLLRLMLNQQLFLSELDAFDSHSSQAVKLLLQECICSKNGRC